LPSFFQIIDDLVDEVLELLVIPQVPVITLPTSVMPLHQFFDSEDVLCLRRVTVAESKDGADRVEQVGTVVFVPLLAVWIAGTLGVRRAVVILFQRRIFDRELRQLQNHSLNRGVPLRANIP